MPNQIMKRVKVFVWKLPIFAGSYISNFNGNKKKGLLRNNGLSNTKQEPRGKLKSVGVLESRNRHFPMDHYAYN